MDKETVFGASIVIGIVIGLFPLIYEKLHRKIDWYDVLGALLVYAVCGSLAFAILYRQERPITGLGFFVALLGITALAFFWERLRWGFKSSFMLIALLLAMLFTPPYYIYRRWVVLPIKNWRRDG